MQTSFLKRLDPSCFRAACVFAATFPKPSFKPSALPLIVRPGGLGDLICADIALQELGRDARDFLWLVEKRSQPWAAYRALPHLLYDGSLPATLAKIWSRHPLVIDTEQLFGLAQAVALLARTRRGRLLSFETNLGAWWANSTAPYDWDATHETISFARLFAAALDLPNMPGAPRLRARTQPADAPPFVLIAGRQSPSRRLPLEEWAKLIDRWQPPGKFLVGAAPEDALFAQTLAEKFPDRATLFTGTFAQLAEQIARSESLFTLDGGGVHIASWFGVPTLAIFTSGRDQKWRPLGQGSRLLRRQDLACQPCTQFGQVPPCPNFYACLTLDEEVTPTAP